MADDRWDAFDGGSSCSDEDESEDEDEAPLQVASFLAQRFLQADSSVPLHQRSILVATANTGLADLTKWKDALFAKQMNTVNVLTERQVLAISDQTNVGIDAATPLYDAVLWLSPRNAADDSNVFIEDGIIQSILVPGGYLVFGATSAAADYDALLEVGSWDLESLEVIVSTKRDDDEMTWKAIQKWSCRIAAEACQWLRRKKNSVKKELRMLSGATVALTAHERTTGSLSVNSTRKAVVAMQKYGYCLVSGLLHAQRLQCLRFGAAVLDDLHAAAAILLEQQGIDLIHPASSTKDPETYRELSMREDCRMDLRHGPALHKIRGANSNRPATFKANNNTNNSDEESSNNDFLRGNANILSIVRRVMNPVVSKRMSAGNVGRYNFDGSGPDGSYQDVNAGIVGGIVSVPGCADQAIHADTPHLFENAADPLPAHYVNVFTPGCPAADRVGQTAFVHGSHRLDFVANYCNTSANRESSEQFDPSIWEHLVRPRLDLGDVLLFDCRILHFGLANQHGTIERPLLYTNLTMHWFHDPKNWDQHRRIFPDDAYVDDKDVNN